jgi:lipid II:glycine glycyltransferase (peptidoglycan interpeptide bridge formation enzyme)
MTTNLLNLKLEEQELFDNINPQTKKYIKLSEKKIRITESQNWEELSIVLKKSFSRRNKISPLKDSYLKHISEQVIKNDMGKIWLAKVDHQIAAVMLQVWDEHSSYYLLGGTNYEYKNNGAMAGLQWNAIKYAKANGLVTYDFEGSMVPGIHKFFNSFGTIVKEYPRIQFFKNKLIAYLYSRKKQ